MSVDVRESIADSIDERADKVIEAGQTSERLWTHAEIADWLRVLADEVRAGVL